MTQEPSAPPLDEQLPPLVSVIDANVFGRTAWIKSLIDAVQDGVLIAVWSPLIICEVNKLLTWLWLERHGGDLSESAWRQCSADFRRWYSNVAEHLHVVSDRPPLEQMWTDNLRDPWDAPIWTAAVRAARTFNSARVFVITENLKDGPPPNQNGIRFHANVLYVHPEQAISMIAAWTTLATTGNLPESDEHMPPDAQDASENGRPGDPAIDLSPGILRQLLELLGAEPRDDESGSGSL
jgi:hypothetical protein